MPGPKSVLPITPAQAVREDVKLPPPYVMKAFNKLVKANLQGTRSQFSQNSVISQIMEEGANLDKHIVREEVFENGWLNVEAVFDKAGWKVTYDKKSIGDKGDSMFLFEIKPSHLPVEV